MFHGCTHRYTPCPVVSAGPCSGSRAATLSSTVTFIVLVALLHFCRHKSRPQAEYTRGQALSAMRL
jgi:hypothetical protein